MAYQTYAEWNRTGIDQLFVYVAEVQPLFVPFLLFSFYMIITLASYFSSKRLGSDGDLPASLSVAGFATTILSLAMSLIPGFIPTEYIIIVIAITVLSVLFLFFSHRR